MFQQCQVKAIQRNQIGGVLDTIGAVAIGGQRDTGISVAQGLQHGGIPSRRDFHLNARMAQIQCFINLIEQVFRMLWQAKGCPGGDMGCRRIQQARQADLLLLADQVQCGGF